MLNNILHILYIYDNDNYVEIHSVVITGSKSLGTIE
jgi:hypothetical protein